MVTANKTAALCYNMILVECTGGVGVEGVEEGGGSGGKNWWFG